MIFVKDLHFRYINIPGLTCLFPHVDERHDVREPWTGAKRHPEVVQAGVWVSEPRPLHTDHAHFGAVATEPLLQHKPLFV